MAELLDVIGPRVGAAPLTIELSQLGTVELESVFAHFDGTAASGTFRPAVTVRSQSGAILARVFPSTTPAAGDTADVTYAPFLDRGGGTSQAYTTVDDEGVALTQRAVLNFTGAGVTAVDNAGQARTDVTIPGAGANSDLGCRVSNSVNITLANTTDTALTFDTELWDTDGMHSTTVNTSRITCNTAGKYLVGGNVYFDTNNTGYRQLDILFNGSVSAYAYELFTATSAVVGVGLNISTVINLAVTDYVELHAKQASGGNLDIVHLDNYSPQFWAQRLAA